jgi:peptide deformylase
MGFVTVLKLYKYPHPILRKPCQRVTEFDDELRQLVADMVETMYDRHGSVGLSAPQVGSAVRVFVMDVNAATTADALRVMVNPVIVQTSRNKIVREGCLSFPEYLANVKRATRCTVEAFDQWGQPFTVEAKHLEAVCIQHEIDHLDGVLMIDRITSLKTDWIRRTGGRGGGDTADTGGGGEDNGDTLIGKEPGASTLIPIKAVAKEQHA